MKYALINGILLDGTEAMQPRPGLSILVNGDRIEALVPAGDEGAGYEKIDLSGGYVMPGLINLHVHLPASGRPTVKQKDTKKIVRLMTSNALLRAITFRVCAGYAKTELLSGVTTLRSVGGIQAVDSCLRDKILSGKAVGPRILAGNMAVSVPGGHMAGSLPYAMFDRSVTGASETEQYNGKLVMDGIIACAKACLKNGIPVGLGTDTGCPYITHYDMWREVYYFHKFCGVTNAFALHTATLGNARLVGLGEETGSLEPGKCADLVVTGENPLEDLKALRHMDLVMARGNLYRSPKVKKMEKAERELDKFL